MKCFTAWYQYRIQTCHIGPAALKRLWCDTEIHESILQRNHYFSDWKCLKFDVAQQYKNSKPLTFESTWRLTVSASAPGCVKNNSVSKGVPFRLIPAEKRVWPNQIIQQKVQGFSSTEAQWDPALHWCVNWMVSSVGVGVLSVFSQGVRMAFFTLKEPARESCLEKCAM